MPGVNDFARIERTYRGTKFVMVEADVATYDRSLKKATKQTTDAATGEEAEEIDENLLLRLLLRECLQEPKISDFAGIGLRLMRQLERDIRELHFGLEPPTEEKRSSRKKAEEPAEDDDSPNDAS
jgi:hypothetical protein